MGEFAPQTLTISCANGHGKVVISDLGLGPDVDLTEIFRGQLNAAIDEVVRIMRRCKGVHNVMNSTCPDACALRKLWSSYAARRNPDDINGFDSTLDLLMQLFKDQSLPPAPSYPQLPSGEGEG